MTNEDSIKEIVDDVCMGCEHLERCDRERCCYYNAIKALENQSFDVDEYRRRLVDKYSEGDKATDVDNGITIALDLLDEMEEETT